MNPRVFDRYEIVKKLTAGGMGEIFLGRQTGVAGFDRLVILKSILPEHASDPDILDQFLNEARIIACINHPNVVAVYEVGEWQSTYFMAMEYVDGVDLAELIVVAAENGQVLTPRFAASVGRDAALGLDYAHHAKDSNGNPLGVIHRDVTPHNIMLRRDGVVKLVDFGVAKAINRRKKTETGVLKGKLGYFAPEQVEGDDIDARADQFVLGVVLWELLTGRRAFPGDNTGVVLRRIASERMVRASRFCLVPPELDDVVYKMTALDPNERYVRIGDAGRALDTYLRAAGDVDGGEVATVVQRLFGKTLEQRANDMKHEVVQLEGRTLTIPKQIVPTSERREDGPRIERRREMAIDLEHAGESAQPIGLKQRMRDSSFREIELDLGNAAPLEVGRTGRFHTDDAHEDDVALDETAPAQKPPPRDEITVVWCELAGLPSSSSASSNASSDASGRREAVLAALRAGATASGSTFASVGDAIVCMFGTQRPKYDDAERGVRLGCELLSLVDDLNGAHATIVARVGVATGLPPARDARGACEPSLQDAAVDRAKRLALAAAPGRVMVVQHTQRVAGKRIRFSQRFVTLIDQWTAPFVGAEVDGYGAPPPANAIKGRDDVVAVIARVVEGAARRRPDALVVLGEPGVGKSALLDEAERIARFKTLAVARASCARSVAPSSFDALRQLVRSLADDVAARMNDDDEAAPPAASGDTGAASALDDPSGAIVMGSASLEASTSASAAAGARKRVRAKTWFEAVRQLGLSAGDVRRLRILLGERDAEPALSLAWRRSLLRGAVAAFFRACAEQIGLCFLLDDLHAIDAGSYAVLSASFAHLAHARVGLVATARPQLSERVFQRVNRIVAGPLAPDVVDTIARGAAFALPLPQPVAQLVRDRAAGNPTRTFLVVRALIASGMIERVHAGFAIRADAQRLAALSSNTTDLVHTILAPLSPLARALLRHAAHVGDVVPHRAFFGADVSAEAGVSATVEAIGTDLVTPTSTGDAIVFRSPTLREAIAALPPDRDKNAKSPALVVAEALARNDDTTALHGRDDALRADQVAYFAAAADAKDHVAAWAARSATYHAACGSADVAADAYQRALVARYKIARAIEARAATSTAADDAAIADVLSLAASAMECLAEIDPVSAADHFVPLLKELPASAAPIARAFVDRQRGRILLQLGRTSDAERVLDEALDLCPPDAEPEEAAHVLALLAQVLEARGNVPSATSQLAEVFRIVNGKTLRDPSFLWSSWLHLAKLRAATGDNDGARSALDDAARCATDAKSARGLAEVDGARARLAIAAGDPASALGYLDDAAAHWVSFGDRANAARSLQAASRIALHALRIDDALDRLQRGIELAAAVDWSEGVRTMQAALAQIERSA